MKKYLKFPDEVILFIKTAAEMKKIIYLHRNESNKVRTRIHSYDKDTPALEMKIVVRW